MKPKPSINYGIQADTIQAEAIAVGDSAQAIVRSSSDAQNLAIGKLSDALKKLELNQVQTKLLLDNLNALKTETPREHPSTMDKIVSIAKEAGHLSALLAPLKALAAAFGIVFPF